jgi:xanthine dehydrogenase accessory factor
MTEHTHDHDDDSACAVAHGAVAPPRPATSATGPAATSATGPAATSATGPAATSATGPAAASASGSARVAGERTLVAVFASPVAGFLLRYGADMGFRGLLLEPDEARAAGAAALGFPLLAAVPDDLDDSVDLVVTDHHRPQLGVMLRDALATKARWVGIMGNPHHAGPHVEMLTELGVPAEEIARVHRPIGLNIGSRTPPEIAISTLAGLLADRNGRPGGFEF